MLAVADRTRGRSALQVWGRTLRISLPVTVATLMLDAGAYGLTSGLSLDKANLMRVIFIGIVSMTYPHVLVVSLAARTVRGTQSTRPIGAGDMPGVQSSTMGAKS